MEMAVLSRKGKKDHQKYRTILLGVLFMAASFLGACQPASVVAEPNPELLGAIPAGLSDQGVAALTSLEQIDDFPLYTMVYSGDLAEIETTAARQRFGNEPAWACSLFAALGDSEEILFGRNFDWDFSPALLLFMDPPGGYASVSMVDIYYLGFGGERAFGITDLPLEEQVELLQAPLLPFDGMNEEGLMVGMAAVPPGNMEMDPAKETIDSLMVIRKILDQAATVDEAVEIIRSYNIDMVGTPIHYLIAEKSGRSALVEFSNGEMVVIPSQQAWQSATNFLLSETPSGSEISCGRFAAIEEQLAALEGSISPPRAMRLLEGVAQPSTQWSVVYRASAGEIWVVMGGKYNQIHKLTSGLE
jgi:hypothetical protein